MIIVGSFSCKQQQSSEPETDYGTVEINTIDDFLENYDLRMHVTFEPTGIGFIINVSGNKLYYVTVNVNRENMLDDLTEQHTLSEDEMKTLEEYCNYLRSGYELKEAKGFDGIEVNIWLDDTCHYLRFGDQNDTIDEMVLFLSEFLPKDVSHIDAMKETKLYQE